MFIKNTITLQQTIKLKNKNENNILQKYSNGVIFTSIPWLVIESSDWAPCMEESPGSIPMGGGGGL